MSFSNLAHFIRDDVSPLTRERFSSYSWCTEILSNASLIPVVSRKRTSKFMYSTLRDHDAILATQAFYVPPPTHISPSASSSSTSTSPPFGELLTLYSLGIGASGYAGIAHGGLIATLLDQQTGSLLSADRAIPKPHTVYCHVQYVRPMLVPSAVGVHAWRSRSEGKKHWVMAEITDGEGTVLATAESLFVSREGNL